MSALEGCMVCGVTVEQNSFEVEAQMHSSREKFTFSNCGHCDLVSLENRVEPSELHRYYTSHYLPYRGAEAWGRFAHLVEKDQLELDKRRASSCQSFHPLDSTSRVLDIGCGKPGFLNQIVELSEAQCTGIDFSNEGWKEHPERYKDLNLEVIEPIAYRASEPFDLITMWHYLEHDYAPRKTLSHLRELSHEDTGLVIEVPDHDSLSRKKYKSAWAGYHCPRHTYLFSPNNITQLLESEGWSVESIDRQGTLDPYTLYWMSEAERRGIDWSASMQSEFYPFVLGMMRFRMANLFKKKVAPHGIMTIYAKRA